MGQLVKKKVRLPNESLYDDVYIDMSLFRPESEYTDETFGWYRANYIAIKKEKLPFVLEKLQNTKIKGKFYRAYEK